jgi:hypothetical protein
VVFAKMAEKAAVSSKGHSLAKAMKNIKQKL